MLKSIHKSTSKLTPAVKKKWLKALRSDKWQQCIGYLCIEGDTGEHFCCLGVLYDLEGEEWIRGTRDSDVWHPIDTDYSEFQELPSKFCSKLGLAEDDLAYLMTANDNGASFSEIADYIEENM